MRLPSPYWILILILALAAAAGLAWATAQGPVGYSDSAAYLVAGRHLAQGEGLGYLQPDGSFYTLTHYPPLYALAFSAFELLGFDLVAAGRGLGVLALAGALLALGGLFRRHSPTPWLGALAAALLLAFPATTGVYASLMSDGPFVTLFLLSLLATLNYLRRPGRSSLAVAVLLTAALPLIRYIGLFSVASAALILLLFADGAPRQRLRTAVTFGAAALLPIGLWLAWVYLGVDASLGGRAAVEASPLALFQQFRAYFTDTAWAWIPFTLTPSTLPYWLRQLAFLALAAGALALGWRLGRTGEEESARKDGALLFWSLAISGGVYLLGLVAAFVFTAPAPDITDRTLLPFLVCALGALLALAGLFIAQRPRWARVTWTAVGAVALLFVAAFAGDTAELATELHFGGQGFFTQRWRESQTLEAVRDLPAGQTIVADRAAALLYWADRPAYEVLEVTGDDLALEPDQGHWLVLFDDFPAWVAARRGPQAAAQAPALTAGLQPAQRLDDGTIYELAP